MSAGLLCGLVCCAHVESQLEMCVCQVYFVVLCVVHTLSHS